MAPNDTTIRVLTSLATLTSEVQHTRADVAEVKSLHRATAARVEAIEHLHTRYAGWVAGGAFAFGLVWGLVSWLA